MVFSSNVFLFVFLPITLLVYYLLGKQFRNYWLLLVSIIFYAWNQPQFLWIILYCIFINYLGGLLIGIADKHKLQTVIVTITIAVNLLCLFYFKYFNFAMNALENVIKREINYTEVILPIGISFFTFQGMSYVFDVYRGKVGYQRNILKLALYITLFPQLIAGPIVRYTDIAEEIDNRYLGTDEIYSGIKRFIVGLFKKVVIANTLAVTADAIWKVSPDENTIAIAWLGAICYTFQIYFDFSGYSDMAIGLGRMLGFHFCENFNYPYISRSVSEFWRRWHISLSSWFRDYIYIPLGGNRKHVYLNLGIVFLLTGIWHGAAYQFILWGIWNGFFIIAERLVRNSLNIKDLKKGKWTDVVAHIYTMFVVIIGWVLFRSDNIRLGVRYLESMFGRIKDVRPGFQVGWYLDRYTVLILIAAILWCTPFFHWVGIKISMRIREGTRAIFENVGLIIMLLYSIIRVVASSYNPFIYFQF